MAVTRLQDKCPHCNKPAFLKSEQTIETEGENKPNLVFQKLECGHTIIKQVPKSKATPFHMFQAYGDPTCNHTWDKNSCVLCGRKRPFPFQIEGMEFGETALSLHSGVAILDEMGLGKTIQAGGIVKFHPELWPCLWVVKSGLKFQFFKFILDWLGDDHVAQIIHTSSDILIPGLKHYIISYDMMVPKAKKIKGRVVQMGFDISKIINSPIKCVVLDECQQIKNPASSRTQQVRQICKGRKVITLSGTPWKNRGGELFSMFNLISPLKFGNMQKYLDTWVDYFWQGGFRKQGGIKNVLRFKEYTKDIAIRRERKDVMPELPTTQRTKLNVKLSVEEEKEYDEAVKEFVDWYQSEQASAASGINILGKISRLRHLTGIAKIPATLEHIETFIEETDKKLVVFVHHQDVGQAIHYQCKEKYEAEGIKVLQLTSQHTPQQRWEIQEEFNKTKQCIMIASTLAAGEGLNLQTGADCIMHERQWNPANEEQAEGRFCRIGQEAPEINAVYTQVVDSIDEYLDVIVEKKRLWFHSVMNTGQKPEWNESEILRELADIIMRQHNRKKAA